MGTKIMIILLLAGAGAAALSCARTAVVLRGQEARERVEAGSGSLLSGPYTVSEIRDRRAGELVLVIFNRDEGGEHGGNFQWVFQDKHMSGKYLPQTRNVVLLDTPEGERGAAPSEATLEELQSGQLYPVAVLDPEGNLRAIVYKRSSASVRAFLRPEGEVRLELGPRLQERGNITYSFEFK